jgi:ABC-type glycerol-3-phosphate transport system substrate-binding protein
MTSRRRLAVGAGLVLALAACGSSKETGSRPIEWFVENAQDPDAQSHLQCATA